MAYMTQADDSCSLYARGAGRRGGRRVAYRPAGAVEVSRPSVRGARSCRVRRAAPRRTHCSNVEQTLQDLVQLQHVGSHLKGQNKVLRDHEGGGGGGRASSHSASV